MCSTIYKVSRHKSTTLPSSSQSQDNVLLTVFLTSLGKVVHNNLLSIQYVLINIWKFRAIDTVRISNRRIYEEIDRDTY